MPFSTSLPKLAYERFWVFLTVLSLRISLKFTLATDFEMLIHPWIPTELPTNLRIVECFILRFGVLSCLQSPLRKAVDKSNSSIPKFSLGYLYFAVSE